MPIAFALSGGGARAAAQVGVLRALLERGIRPDMVVGASAGAVNGAWLALDPDGLDDLESVWRGLTKRRVFPGTPAHYAYNLFRKGHVHPIDSWGRVLDLNFGSRVFEQARFPLTVVTVRLSDGAVVAHDRGPISPALKASTAVPGLFPPQRIGDDLHVDGAVVEFLPIPTAMRLGATEIYAVDSSDFAYGDGVRGSTMDRSGQLAATAWVGLVVDRARTQGLTVHRLRPPLGDIYDGRDFRHTVRLIADGYAYASAAVAGVQAAL